MTKPIHYQPEYGPDGLVERLYWSPEIQAAGDARVAEQKGCQAEHERIRLLVIPAMREWAELHGIPQPRKSSDWT